MSVNFLHLYINIGGRCTALEYKQLRRLMSVLSICIPQLTSIPKSSALINIVVVKLSSPYYEYFLFFTSISLSVHVYSFIFGEMWKTKININFLFRYSFWYIPEPDQYLAFSNLRRSSFKCIVSESLETRYKAHWNMQTFLCLFFCSVCHSVRFAAHKKLVHHHMYLVCMGFA